MTVRILFLAGVAALVTFTAPVLHGQAGRGKAALLKPAEAVEQAPATFKINFATSAGSFVVEVHRDWAPLGVDRVYNLVKRGFYDGVRFSRAMAGYLIQFGISGDPDVTKAWIMQQIPKEDPVKQSNLRGFVSFAPAGAGRRTTQLIINLVDNKSLDSASVAPFGRVVSGMDVVDKIYTGYGDWAPNGDGPEMNRMYFEGTPYLEKMFPKMDYIKTATIVQ